MTELVAILIIILVAVAVIWLYNTYVKPALPNPIGVIILVIIAVVFILILLQRLGIF